MAQSRLQFDKPINYSAGVLIGKWVDNRSEVYECNFKNTTTYTRDYVKKPLTTHKPSVRQDIRIKNEGHGLYTLYPLEDPPNYSNNYSTSSDLSYNHFPKWYNDFIYRKLRFKLHKFEPSDEYLSSFGNITNYGLVDYKKSIWEKEFRSRTTKTSQYSDMFLAPETEAYKFPRRTLIRSSEDLKMKPTGLTVCNPINWECKCECKWMP